jgi:UDP-N-acetylmuramoyl-tripeptide--D-alanyl-D-alanine ligase
MMLWTAPDLAAALNTNVNFAASGVSIDTRSLQPGDLFVALADQRDGHEFVQAALDKGASGALIRQGALDLPPGTPVIEVDDTLEALRALARFARQRFTGKLVAVTGSVGKTSTKEMLRTALSTCGTVHAADASFNNHIGVPLTLARMPAGADYAVIEIGMNHPGEITPLAQLSRPDVALITNVAAAHIGHMGSLAAIADEKAAIFTGLAKNGTAVIDLATPYFDRLIAAANTAGADIIKAGTGQDAELMAAQLSAEGSDLVVRLGHQKLELHLAAAGAHMAQNAVMVLAACGALGADPAQAAVGLAQFAPGSGRGARKPILGGSAVLLDESYNASSLSIRAALALLALIPARRHIAVLGDMLETGDFGPAEHAGLAPDVMKYATLLFTCGPLMRHLHQSVPASLAVMHAEDAAHLAPLVAAAIRPGDAVLVKGSLGSNMRLVVEVLTTITPENRDAV